MRQQLGAAPSRTTDDTTKTYVDTAIATTVKTANNLSDLASASSARTNLGLGTAAVLAGPSSAIVGISDTQTLTGKTLAYGSNTITGLPYDLSIMGFGMATTRATGTGDNPMGIALQRAVTLTSVTFRCYTADASGNLVVQLNRNGSVISGTSTTIAAASQVAGATTTFSQVCSVGDIITINVTGVGTTPGNGLVADIKGSF